MNCNVRTSDESENAAKIDLLYTELGGLIGYQADRVSNQEIEQVLSELESAGLIVYNRADDEVQIIV